MDIFYSLAHGFSVALQPVNLLVCFLGALMGTLIGVLPGIGPVGAIAILLPVTFHLSPTAAIIMLAGIYYGAMYGGSTTSILVNIPGESASVVTCLDGYQMAKQGRAGPALGIAAFGSFIAGTFGVIGVSMLAAPLAGFALKFGSPEYFGLCLLGLSLVTYLSAGSAIKAMIMAAFGLILSCVGLDVIYGSSRMTFNVMELWDGINIIPIAMGLFGIPEVLANIEKTETRTILKTKIKSFFPTLADWGQSKWAIVRGSILGFFIGILPGGHPVIASFLSYGVEKRVSKEPERFGKGAIEGVAGPESANNSATAGGFIPLFILGIPANAVMALMFGALMIHGMRPGPQLLTEQPDLFWGVISSMYIGNGMLLVLNLPLIPMWVQVLKIPYRILFPLILLFCIIGTYSIRNSTFDVILLMIFGLLGYLFKKFEYEPAPLILAFVLGPMVEANLRQSLLFSSGSFLIFFTRPISAILVSIAIIMIIAAILPHFTRGKRMHEKA
ncbi:MAG: tripartite tricarboxylate transporter permease [Desulfobacterales bacterium]|nr:tripartite tricarboxylate transporter permease [Desulfobacterales bacterium]